MQVAIAAASAAACVAVAAIATARYRAGGDQHALFLATGFGVLAAQAALFGLLWPLHYGQGAEYAITVGATTVLFQPLRSFSGAAPAYGFQLGWLVSGACFVFGVPWWDRRGRPSVRLWRGLLAIATLPLVADACIAVAFLDGSGVGVGV